MSRVLQLILFVMATASLTFSAIAAGEEPGAVHIILRSQAVLGGQRCAVADIAQVISDDPVLKRKIDQIELGNAPRIGYVERYTRAELVRALRRQLSAAIDLKWDGALSVSVSAMGQMVDGTALFEVAKNALLQQLQVKYDRVTVRPLGAPVGMMLPVGAVTYQPRLPDVRRLLLREVVHVDIIVDGMFYKSAAVPLSVQAERQIVVAKHDVTKGTLTSFADFEVVEMDAVTAPADAVGSKEIGDGVRVKNSLHEGQIVTRNFIGRNSAVANGETVKLVVEEGSVEIEVPGIASADGDIGQTVTVRPQNSGKSMVGKVVAPGVVRVN